MRCEIRIDGRPPRALTEAFPRLARCVVGEQTLLFGPVADEAQVYGLLARCRSLGLRVVEMRVTETHRLSGE
ncbi:hypothetical protein ACIHAA_24855 [Streptomyces sp. NPDC052040]|uniref:hypothetical protein n=1 Tax=unclassified Streptomyces TaxID=2593676 RepID=UPI0037D17039